MRPTSIEIIKKLKEKGFEAYWAGGCVRDMLIGIEPKDFDIVTSAKPEEIEDALEKTIPIGKEFGVILAIEGGHHFEIATFRSDAGYSDGRRPDAVEFKSAEEDAFRRDFTINGLFYDPLEDRVIDYVEGQKDLDLKLVRFIGDPEERIKEDHLRILRAIRFKNTLDFQYEPKTFQAVRKYSHLISKVSKERIADEINKIIMGKNVSVAFEDLQDTGILKEILPEFENLKGVAQPYQYHKEGDVWEHTMRAVDSLDEFADLSLRWAVLLHDVGKPDTFKIAERIRFDSHAKVSAEIARKVLKRLRQPKKMIDKVCWMVEHHMMMVQLLEMPLGRKRHWFTNEWFPDLIRLFKADIDGTIPGNFDLYHKVNDEYRKTLDEMPKRPDPLVNGNDVCEITGLKPGPEVGEVLKEIYHLQLEGELTSREEALDKIKDISQTHL